MSEWISVKDRLPEGYHDCCEHDYVLVMCEESNKYDLGPLLSIANRRDGKWDFAFGNHGAYSCEGIFALDSEDITHWMPLPEIPGVENEKDK